MRSAMAMATAVFLGVGNFVAHADYRNVTGQPQMTPDRGPSNPGKPEEPGNPGDTPSLPGDQPRKAGTDAGNPVNSTADSPVNSKKPSGEKH
jgi:hypothetical protein